MDKEKKIVSNEKEIIIGKTGRLTDKYTCKDTSIEINTIKEILTTSIQTHINSAVERKKILEATPLKSKLQSLKLVYADVDAELTKRTIRLKELLQDNFEEKIDKIIFANQKEIISLKRTETEQKLLNLNAEITEITNKINFDTSYIENYAEFENFTEITDEMLKLLVSEILVYDNSSIEIKWAFSEKIK